VEEPAEGEEVEGAEGEPTDEAGEGEGDGDAEAAPEADASGEPDTTEG
jgi:hypothetical protein